MSVVIDINSLDRKVSSAKEKFNKDQGKYTMLKENLENKSQEKAKLEKKHGNLDKTRLIYMKSAEYQREKVKREFEEIVTNALQFIRNEDIYFEIDLEERRGHTEADFYVKTIRDGIETRKMLETTSLKDSKGDGIYAIVKVALDVALLEISGEDGPLVLDEPIKELSIEYIERAAEFLKNVSLAFNRQIIVNDNKHIENMSMAADKKFVVTLEGTISKVEEVILGV